MECLAAVNVRLSPAACKSVWLVLQHLHVQQPLGHSEPWVIVWLACFCVFSSQHQAIACTEIQHLIGVWCVSPWLCVYVCVYVCTTSPCSCQFLSPVRIVPPDTLKNLTPRIWLLQDLGPILKCFWPHLHYFQKPLLEVLQIFKGVFTV